MHVCIHALMYVCMCMHNTHVYVCMYVCMYVEKRDMIKYEMKRRKISVGTDDFPGVISLNFDTLCISEQIGVECSLTLTS